MPEYNWPSKIKRYGITCPYQKFLVAKYESIIDWNADSITTPEALDTHICKKMLPALKKRVDPKAEESHYCRTLNLSHMLANPAPHIEEARKIQAQSGEDAARTFLLDHINGHKKEVFESWWQYLAQENPVFAQTPSFQYLMLRPVIDSSDAKCTRSPVNPDAEALAGVFDGIASGQINPTTKLMRTLCEFMAFGKQADGSPPRFGTACAWVVINRNLDNAPNRVAAFCQGSGWCVASPSMARIYLCGSDFHILLEEGRPVAALRERSCDEISPITSECSKLGAIVEIQGRKNEDPQEWWPRILLYCALRGLTIQHRKDAADQAKLDGQKDVQACDNIPLLAAHLSKHPAKVMFVDEDVANDVLYRPVIESAWLACLAADSLCEKVVPTWMERDSRFDMYWAEGWRNLLLISPDSVVDMPQHLCLLAPVAREAVRCWASILRNNHELFELCPSPLHGEPSIQEPLIFQWDKIVRKFPGKIKECPPLIAQSPEMRQALKSGWMRRIRKDPRKLKNCPKHIANDPDILKAVDNGWEHHIANNIMDLIQNENSIPEQSPPTDAMVAFWKSPYNTRDFGWEEWMGCPKFVTSDVTIARRAVVPITHALRRDPSIWLQIISPWREMQELREEASQNWATHPGYEDKAPPEDIRVLVLALRSENS